MGKEQLKESLQDAIFSNLKAHLANEEGIVWDQV